MVGHASPLEDLARIWIVQQDAASSSSARCTSLRGPTPALHPTPRLTPPPTPKHAQERDHLLDAMRLLHVGTGATRFGAVPAA